jgi:NAD(P)-dependent dehydrogenase (short-subunit alcohol dehydrogenase family)
MRLDGKAAIVTGAGAGIGKACARKLAQEGAAVVVAERSESDGTSAAEKILASGGQALFVRCDVSIEQDVKTLINRTVEIYGTLDILVNNAGVPGSVKPVSDLSLKEWRSAMSINLDGTFLCCKYALPVMMEKKTGVIINMASVSGKRPMPLRSVYTTAKMGVIGLTRTLAAEVGSFNIRVNAICPGSVTGERQQTVFEGIMRSTGTSLEEVRKMKAESAALKSFVEPEDVASLVVFLASDESRKITGQDINVCAGAVMS